MLEAPPPPRSPVRCFPSLAGRSRPDSDTLCLWVDLCSAISRESLSALDISGSFLSKMAVRVLCDYLTRVSCRLQRVT